MTTVTLEAAVVAPDARRAEARLLELLSQYDRVAVAFSGGVDSTLVLSAAVQVLGDKAVALTAVSESLARRELENCRDIAAAIGARHVELPTDEVADERYAQNTPSRCYWCKDVVYAALVAYARDNDLGPVLDGMNRDDTLDHRPGRRAALEHGVISPLFEAELAKADVRAVARLRGLAVWAKPAMACLSSRIPYGEAVTPAKLGQIEAAEDVLAELGISQFRVRHHGPVARIEVGAEDLPVLVAHRDDVDRRLKAIGFTHVAVDLAGYRQGSLNAALRPGS